MSANHWTPEERTWKAQEGREAFVAHLERLIEAKHDEWQSRIAKMRQAKIDWFDIAGNFDLPMRMVKHVNLE